MDDIEKKLAKGVEKGIWRVLTMFAVAYFAIVIYGKYSNYKRDDTDSTEYRSNLKLHTDYGTGCQYLSALRGGVTPRIDNTGKHMGCREI